MRNCECILRGVVRGAVWRKSLNAAAGNYTITIVAQDDPGRESWDQRQSRGSIGSLSERQHADNALVGES